MTLLLAIACTTPGPDPAGTPPELLDRAEMVISGSADAPVGRAVFALGDLNGDGIEDLGVARGRGREPGQLAILLGGRSGEVAADNADTVIELEEDEGSFVYTGRCEDPKVPGHRNVLGLGDIDGDGLDELAIGLPKARDGGVVAIFTGLQVFQAAGALGLSDARWLLEGYRDTAAFGADLAAGRLDGDELPDLVVGAPLTGDRFHGGEVYVAFGARLAAESGHRVSYDQVGARLRWPDTGDMAGDRVAVLPDLDGDEHDELLVLAPACEGSLDGHVDRVDTSSLASLRNVDAPVVASLATLHPLRGNLVEVPDDDGDGLWELAVGGYDEAVAMFPGNLIARETSLLPTTTFSTGADSASQLAAMAAGSEAWFLADDGGYLLRVRGPLRAEGWHKSDALLIPCRPLELHPEERLLATGDFDGDGAVEIAVGDWSYPCDSSDPGGLVAVVSW